MPHTNTLQALKPLAEALCDCRIQQQPIDLADGRPMSQDTAILLLTCLKLADAQEKINLGRLEAFSTSTVLAAVDYLMDAVNEPLITQDANCDARVAALTRMAQRSIGNGDLQRLKDLLAPLQPQEALAV